MCDFNQRKNSKSLHTLLMLIHENILNSAFISSETISKTAAGPCAACCVCVMLFLAASFPLWGSCERLAEGLA